jgi:hypothetical protein
MTNLGRWRQSTRLASAVVRDQEYQQLTALERLIFLDGLGVNWT